MSDECSRKFVRCHHKPDEIINGKPKWSQVLLVRDKKGGKSEESLNKTLNIDRLNPTRLEMEELDENFGDDAGIIGF